MYHKSVAKVNAIDKIPNNSGLLSKTDYDSDKQNLDVDKKNNPILVSSSKKSDYNTKITEVENKIPSITGWVTTAALNPKVIKIPKQYLIRVI